eukprot:PhM_4_TR2658/c0_g1_i1/m.23828
MRIVMLFCAVRSVTCRGRATAPRHRKRRRLRQWRSHKKMLIVKRDPPKETQPTVPNRNNNDAEVRTASMCVQTDVSEDDVAVVMCDVCVGTSEEVVAVCSLGVQTEGLAVDDLDDGPFMTVGHENMPNITQYDDDVIGGTLPNNEREEDEGSPFGREMTTTHSEMPDVTNIGPSCTVGLGQSPLFPSHMMHSMMQTNPQQGEEASPPPKFDTRGITQQQQRAVAPPTRGAELYAEWRATVEKLEAIEGMTSRLEQLQRNMWSARVIAGLAETQRSLTAADLYPAGYNDGRQRRQEPRYGMDYGDTAPVSKPPVKVTIVRSENIDNQPQPQPYWRRLPTQRRAPVRGSSLRRSRTPPAASNAPPHPPPLHASKVGLSDSSLAGLAAVNQSRTSQHSTRYTYSSFQDSIDESIDARSSVASVNDR